MAAIPQTTDRMTPAERNQFLKTFHNNLKDEPLPPDHEWYVPYLQRSGQDPIAHLAKQIDWRESDGLYLLSGHPGSGKSTEMLRLKKLLEERGCVVFMADMAQHVNLFTPIEITDFLISLSAALAEAVKEARGHDPLVEGYGERLRNFLQTRVGVDGISFDIGPMGVSTSLRDDMSFRRRVQEALKGHVATLVRDVHDFAEQIVAAIRKEAGDPGRKVVLLVDSLEKIRGVGAEAEAVHNSVKNLFAAHAESLRLPLVHVLYTLPPWLTALAPGLGAQLGSGVQTIPSIHVYKTRSRHADPRGVELMREIVQKRFPNFEQVFPPELLERAVLSTGGDLREFFYLLRYCLLELGASGAPLPVGEEVLSAGESNMRRGMLPIAKDDVAWLRRIAATNSPQLETVRELPGLARFFDTKLVLNYRNGEDWYDIHPLLRDVVGTDGAP